VPRGAACGSSMPKGQGRPTATVITDVVEDRLKQFSKTKLCKFYVLGQCARGSACRYAHDATEIKSLPDLTCTKLCPRLVSLGCCMQAGCTYAHHREQLRGTSMYHKTKICRFAQTGLCTLGSKCNFAHSDLEIRQAQGCENSIVAVPGVEPQKLPEVELHSAPPGLAPPLPPPPQLSSGYASGLGIFSEGRSDFTFNGSMFSDCSFKGFLSEPAYVSLGEYNCTADVASTSESSLVVDQSNHAWQVTRAFLDAPAPSAIRAVRTSQSTLCTLGEYEGPEREMSIAGKVASQQAQQIE